MRIHVMTLFPEIIESYIGESIIKRGIENGHIDIKIYNIRDFSENKHKKVDDYPFGGGAGMVMTPQPIISTFEHIVNTYNIDSPNVIYMSPKGRTLSQDTSKELSNNDDIILLCGHYEGIDQRVIDKIVTDEISIGDYVLTGGELAALVVIDSVSRLVPGVLNRTESFEDESFENNLLEYPQYTRPREFMGMEVPDVLLSGNHKNIEEWRKSESERLTKERRPDLWDNYKKGNESMIKDKRGK